MSVSLAEAAPEHEQRDHHDAAADSEQPREESPGKSDRPQASVLQTRRQGHGHAKHLTNIGSK
jgi:hypothetical protein